MVDSGHRFTLCTSAAHKRGAGALSSFLLLMALSTNYGCLSERSFRMRADDCRMVAVQHSESSGSMRARLRLVHGELRDLLPANAPSALLTEDMSDDTGSPVDVFGHFGLDRTKLQKLFGNWNGIRCTAQAASRSSFIDKQAPQWPGFEDTWIPVREDLSLSARIGYARDGETVANADAIVLLPGLLGDHGVLRTRDLAVFLRDCGFHVVSLDTRGCGQTEYRYPNACHTFGVFETDELLLVSDWLVGQPHVRRTGLVGFCWSGNVALIAAWYDGRASDDPSILPSIARELQSQPTGGRRFEAGMIAFSPILRWEDMVDILDTPRTTLKEPIYAAIQDTVRTRARRKAYESRSGNLRQLIEDDFRACETDSPERARDAFPFLRLMPYRNGPWRDKLEAARVPVLIVHGCDDPLAPAQDVADFMATVSNPNVAAVILPGGGHVGFAAYAKSYYFSLVSNFFRQDD